MSGGFIGLFGAAGGGAGSSQTPAAAGFIHWDWWTSAGLALHVSEVGLDATREDRSDNRLYLRTERLAQTTARPGDVMFSASGTKSGWLVCDGVSTVGNASSGATYAGDEYRQLWEALAVGVNWDNGVTVTLPSSPAPGSSLTALIKI